MVYELVFYKIVHIVVFYTKIKNLRWNLQFRFV